MVSARVAACVCVCVCLQTQLIDIENTVPDIVEACNAARGRIAALQVKVWQRRTKGRLGINGVCVCACVCRRRSRCRHPLRTNHRRAQCGMAFMCWFDDAAHVQMRARFAGRLRCVSSLSLWQPLLCWAVCMPLVAVLREAVCLAFQRACKGCVSIFWCFCGKQERERIVSSICVCRVLERVLYGSQRLRWALAGFPTAEEFIPTSVENSAEVFEAAMPTVVFPDAGNDAEKVAAPATTTRDEL